MQPRLAGASLAGAIPYVSGAPSTTPIHDMGTHVVNVSFFDGVPYKGPRHRCEGVKSRSSEQCGAMLGDLGKRFCAYHENQANEERANTSVE